MEFVRITSPHMVRSPRILPKSLGQFHCTDWGSQSMDENLTCDKNAKVGENPEENALHRPGPSDCTALASTPHGSGYERRSSARQFRWHSGDNGMEEKSSRNSHRQSLCAFIPPNHGSHMYRIN